MKKFLILILLSVLFSANSFGIQLKSAGMSDKDMLEFDTNVKDFALNSALNKAGITIDSINTEDIKIVNPVNYTYYGRFYQALPQTIDLSAVVNASVGTQAVSTYRKYLLSVNTSGTFNVTAGESKAYDTATLPEVPTGYTAIGYFKVKTDASTTYICGTTGLDDSGLTVTYISLRAVTSGPSKVAINETVIDSDSTTESTSLTVGSGLFLLVPTSTTPNSPVTGNMFYDETAGKSFIYDGSSWNALW